MTDRSGPTFEQLCDNARAMWMLPERDRNVLIALGVLQSRVIDARHRFDKDFVSICACDLDIDDLIAPTVTTVFEGTFFPGDCA